MCRIPLFVSAGSDHAASRRRPAFRGDQLDDLRHFVVGIFRAVDAGTLDMAGAACELSRRLCWEVACDRASIVTLDEARVVRLGGFDAQLGTPLAGDVELSNKSPTAHHVADRRMGVYPPLAPASRSDADSDGWPQALRELYLAPQGLESLAVAAIGNNPNVTGFVCAASLTERQWSLADMAKLRLIANAIALRRARLGREVDIQAVLAPDRGS